jgi:hypothetical protein
MEPEHSEPCNILWNMLALLCRSAPKVFEMKQERAIFLCVSNNNDDAYLFHNGDFIQKLSYMVNSSEN